MEEMCTYITPYKCKICGGELLFFETDRHTLIDYKYLFMRSDSKDTLINRLRNKHIKFIKCLQCNRSYIIDWTNGYPQQLMNKKALTKFGIRLL